VGFATIVADPPWKVAAGRSLSGYVMSADGSKQLFNVANQAARPLAYPSMSVQEIADLPVASIAAPAAHLYLWTINRYLRDAFEVMAAWGFTYSTTLVWAKRPKGGGLGGCYGLATEYVLFGRRGTCRASARIGRNWFDWKRPYDERGKPKHSAKPPQFFDMVEQVSPGPYAELFARSPRDGWSVWGNEVNSDFSFTPITQPQPGIRRGESAAQGAVASCRTTPQISHRT
jgi:N6-adenosine-specific RNA methylase IME4